jgi:hypothetical protein
MVEISKVIISFCIISLAFCEITIGENLYVIHDNGKEGYINCHGEIIIEPEYSSAQPFVDGYAIVEKKNFFVINDSGKKISNVNVNSHLPIIGAREFKNGIAVVKFLTGGAAFVNRNGEQLFNTCYEDAKSFSFGLSAIKINGKWGYIDETGNIVISNKFDMAEPFSGGIAHVSIDNKWGFIDSNGDFLVTPKYLFIAGNHSNGLSLVFDKHHFKYVDRYGKQLFEVSQIEKAQYFSEGFARVTIKGRAGYINTEGKVIIEPRFDDAVEFSDGMASVKLSGKWGFIDRIGNLVIKPQFSSAAFFKNGLAKVFVNDELSGYIDKKGEYVWRPGKK